MDNEMTRKSRRCLFYGLCGAFLFVGSGAILYADGWRIDVPTFAVKKVVAIYVRSFPADANIALNGKPIKNKSGLLDHGTFISGLFPKNYTLTLSAEGYRDWKEHVAVKPSLVSELKYAVLIPKTPEKVSTTTAADFWIIDGDPVVQNSAHGLSRQGEKLPGARVVGQTNNSKNILTENEKTKTYFLTDASGDQPVSKNLNPIFTNLGLKPSGFSQIFQDPAGGNNLIIQNPHSILLFDSTNSTLLLSEKSTTTIGHFAASPSWFAWTHFNSQTNTSSVILYNRSSKERIDAGTLPGNTIKLAFSSTGDLGILQDNGSFYILKSGAGHADAIASSVKDFLFSPKGNFVAALGNESIEIFAFNSDKDYWRFRLPDNGAVERLEWYADEAHLFVVYPDSVRFLDLNDKALENLPEIVSTSKATYDSKSNVLYSLKDSRIWKLEFPK